VQRILDTANLAEAKLIMSILAEKGICPPALRTVPRFSAQGVEMFYTVELPVEKVDGAKAALKPYGYVINVT
jgi:hypothetical protein